jgi:hypothetical protein
LQDPAKHYLPTTRHRITLAWHGAGFLGFDTHANAERQHPELARDLPADFQVRKLFRGDLQI